MSLYICNATTRDHHLHYRLPPKDGRDPVQTYTQVIRAGSQIEAPHKDTEDVKAIIRQIAIYGARTSDEAARAKDFSGIIYSTTKPVSVDSITAGLQHVDELAIERAQLHRTTNAVASDDLIARDAQDRGEQVSNLEIEVIEQARPGVHRADLKRQTIEVQREGSKPKRAKN